MLQLFRSGFTSYFATALLGLLVASFALWGIGGNIMSGTGSNVAKIGDKKLSKNDYSREFQNKFSELQQNGGDTVTRAMAIDQGYAKEWITDLVQRETFSQAAHDLKIRITNNQLRNFIMNINLFQDTLGQFSKTKFASIARFQGYSAQEFEEILRRDLERQSLIASIGSAVLVPDAVQKILVKYILEERTAEVATVSASGVKKITQPTEKDLKKYYQEHSEDYMAPEYRTLRFIILSHKDFEKSVSVTAAEIDEAMITHGDVAAQMDKWDLQQILFSNKDAADKAYNALKKGRSFNDIITDSGSSVEDASTKDNTKKDVTDLYGSDAARLVFNTKEGDYTNPVNTEFGWRIFKVTKLTTASTDIKKLRTEAEEDLKKGKALDALYAKTELINDELAAGSTLADIAANLNLTLETAADVDITGHTAQGTLVATIPKDTAFLTKAFNLLDGEEPALEELSDGDYVLIVVDHIKQPDLRPYEDVKSSVVDIWRSKARIAIARKKANELQAAAQAGKTLAELSSGKVGTAYTTVTLARNDQTGKVSRAIRNSIFSLNINDAKVVPAADGDGFVVVKVLSRKLSDGTMTTEKSAQLKKILVQEYQQRILSNYWLYLRNTLPVIINAHAIEAVNNQLASREQ